MINFDDYVNENKTKDNKNWPYIILIIKAQGLEKQIYY